MSFAMARHAIELQNRLHILHETDALHLLQFHSIGPYRAFGDPLFQDLGLFLGQRFLAAGRHDVVMVLGQNCRCVERALRRVFGHNGHPIVASFESCCFRV